MNRGRGAKSWGGSGGALLNTVVRESCTDWETREKTTEWADRVSPEES